MPIYHVTVAVHLTYEVDTDSEAHAQHLVYTSAQWAQYPSIRIGGDALEPIGVHVDVDRVECTSDTNTV